VWPSPQPHSRDSCTLFNLEATALASNAKGHEEILITVVSASLSGYSVDNILFNVSQEKWYLTQAVNTNSDEIQVYKTLNRNGRTTSESPFRFTDS